MLPRCGDAAMTLDLGGRNGSVWRCETSDEEGHDEEDGIKLGARVSWGDAVGPVLPLYVSRGCLDKQAAILIAPSDPSEIKLT